MGERAESANTRALGLTGDGGWAILGVLSRGYRSVVGPHFPIVVTPVQIWLPAPKDNRPSLAKAEVGLTSPASLGIVAVLATRVSFSGRTPLFQSGDTSSNLVTRTKVAPASVPPRQLTSWGDLEELLPGHLFFQRQGRSDYKPPLRLCGRSA